jgi:hypothetical protein
MRMAESSTKLSGQKLSMKPHKYSWRTLTGTSHVVSTAMSQTVDVAEGNLNPNIIDLLGRRA